MLSFRLLLGSFLLSALYSLASSLSMSTTLPSANNVKKQSSWTPLHPDSLVSAPCLIDQTLCQPSDDRQQQPQLAAHVEYATAVFDAWRADEENSALPWNVEWCHVQYTCDDDDDTMLYGHWIRRVNENDDDDRKEERPLQTILLFHTGAGPHDLFLLWKASSLVSELANNCQVLIADVLSDESGWAWSTDRTRYQKTRQALDDNDLWRKRVEAAVQVGSAKGDVVAALGWCLGGRAITELAQLAEPPAAMVTFHGVFSSTQSNSQVTTRGSQLSDILVCHGVDDPFVPSADLEQALSMFQTLGHRTSLLQLQARHGFTNPAQEFNTNPAFDYDAEAANKSWRQAVGLLRRTLDKAEKVT